MAEIAQRISNVQGDGQRWSAVSPLGTTRASAAKFIHHDHDLQVAEEPFLGVLSVRQSRRQADRLGVGDLLAGWTLALPVRPMQLVGTPDLSCAWIEPRAWIVTSTATRATSLKSVEGIDAIDVSDRMSAFRLSGARAVEIVASGCDPAIVPPGSCTRARCANLGAVCIQRWTSRDWRLLVDVSLAHVFALWLRDAATNTAPGKL